MSRIICNCDEVSEDQLCDVLDAFEIDSIVELRSRLKICTGCRTCSMLVEEYIDDWKADREEEEDEW